VLLSLSDDRATPPARSAWIGSLLALGARLSRRSDSFAGQRLIVAISVPSHELAAALVGAGWTLARPLR